VVVVSGILQAADIAVVLPGGEGRVAKSNVEVSAPSPPPRVGGKSEKETPLLQVMRRMRRRLRKILKLPNQRPLKLPTNSQNARLTRQKPAPCGTQSCQ
jgi:hypothetical protein